VDEGDELRAIMGNSVLRLYRNVLKAAQRYPSVKRDQLIADIKEEFRSNKYIQDPEELQKKIKIAQEGLGQLKMYTELDRSSNEWSLSLKGGLQD